MPGVRSGSSTLAAEAAVAGSYLQLCAELEPQHAGWQVNVEEPLPDLPFPRLLLPQLVDRLVECSTPSLLRHFVLGRRAGRWTLQLDARVAAHWLPPALLYRLRVGLHTVWPDGWMLDINDAGDLGMPALLLTWPIEASACDTGERPSPPPIDQGAEPWTTFATTTN
jgi:hypothetical protein